MTFTFSDLDLTPLSFIPIENLYPDFTSEWYITVGKSIVQTMVINAFMPYMNFTMNWLRLYYGRRKDQKDKLAGYETKTSTI